MAINVINKTSYDTESLTRFISLAVSHHESRHLFGTRDAEAEFILVPSFLALEKEWRSFYKLKAKDHLPNFSGLFLTPETQANVLRILISVKSEHLPAIDRYFFEAENGSQARTPGTDMEKRGLLFMSIFDLLEIILHEYTHLCVYECFRKTQGQDSQELFSDTDVTLHDEYITRYLAVRLSLEILEPYMEPNLFFSILVRYLDHAKKSLSEETSNTRAYLEQRRKELKQMQTMLGISDQDFAHQLEQELGHPVSPEGISYLDIAEYISFGAMEKAAKKYVYQVKNPLACYSGAHLMGTMQAFYDAGHSLFLGEEGFLPAEELRLENVFQKPFVECFSMDDFQRIQAGIQSMMERFLED